MSFYPYTFSTAEKGRGKQNTVYDNGMQCLSRSGFRILGEKGTGIKHGRFARMGATFFNFME